MKIFIILTMLLASLAANSSFDRVLVTKTTKQSKLKYIKRKLDSINVKMFVQTIPSGYYVYSDKITNKNTANAMLRKIRTQFPYAKIVTIGQKEEPKANANENIENSTQEEFLQNNTAVETTEATEDISVKQSSFFLSLGAGYCSTEASTNYEPASNLNNNGLSYTLEAGFNYNKNIFVTLDYSDTSTDDISMNHMYGSLNYRLNLLGGLDIFAGALLGYSELVIGANINSTASTTMLYGLQGGISYNVDDSIFIFTSYQMLMADHVINLTNAGEKIELSSLNNMQIGIGYRF